jgi:hypothetical protein
VPGAVPAHLEYSTIPINSVKFCAAHLLPGAVPAHLEYSPIPINSVKFCAAHLVPGAVPAHLEDQLLLPAGVLHRPLRRLLWTLRRDMRTLLLQGKDQSICIS